MKQIIRLFILFFALSYLNGLSAQNLDLVWFKGPEDQGLRDLIQKQDGSFVCNIAKGVSTDNPDFYTPFYYSNSLYQLNENLQITDSCVLEVYGTSRILISRLFEGVDGQLVATGIAWDTLSNDFQLYMAKLGAHLQLMNEKLLGLPNRSEYTNPVLKNQEGNLVCQASINPTITANTLKQSEAVAFWEFTFDGNEIIFVTDTIHSIHWGLVPLGNSGQYHASTADSILRLNADFSVDTVFAFNYPHNFTPFFKEPFVDNTYFITGDFFNGTPENWNDFDFGMLQVDAQGQQLQFLTMGTLDTLDRYGDMAYLNPDTLFVGGSKNYVSGYHDTWLLIYKIIPNGEVLYKRTYGGAGRYTLTKLLPLPGGGCLVGASWWDFYHNDSFTNDVLLLRLDADGLITGTDNEFFTLAKQTITVFPNPFTDEVHFVTETDKNAELTLYDVKGRKILMTELQSGGCQNLSALPIGMYFYQLVVEGEVPIRGKLQKMTLY
jgi:hypothetical protein